MVGKYDASHCGECGSCEDPHPCGVCPVDNWSVTIGGISNGVGFDACNGCSGLNSTFIVPYTALATIGGLSCGHMITSNLCTTDGGGLGSGAACCYELLGISIGIGTGGGNPGGACTGRIHVLIYNCVNGKVIQVRVASPQGGQVQFEKYFAGTSLCTASGESIPRKTGHTNAACTNGSASCSVTAA